MGTVDVVCMARSMVTRAPRRQSALCHHLVTRIGHDDRPDREAPIAPSRAPNARLARFRERGAQLHAAVLRRAIGR